eukprot:scpid65864/ scgid24135/ ADP-ribosylation factor-like protein 3
MSDLPYPEWLKSAVLAGTTTAAIAFAVYCVRAYASDVKDESNIVYVRNTNATKSSTSSISSYDVDGLTAERRVASKVRTSERRSMTRFGPGGKATIAATGQNIRDFGDENDEWADEAQDQLAELTTNRQRSYAPDPFDGGDDDDGTDDVARLGSDRPRSASLHPNISMGHVTQLGSSSLQSTATRKRVLLLGLDGAGKSSLLRQLSNFESLSSRYVPTEGFRVIAMATQSCRFDMYEVGGSQKNREYWTKFLDKIDLLMFVMDGCSNDERLELASEELKKVLSDSRMDGIPLLLIVTHQDRLQCLSPDEAAKAMDLDSYAHARHLCRPVGVSLHHGDPPEGLAKLRNWMFPVLARGVEIQDDQENTDEEEEGGDDEADEIY